MIFCGTSSNWTLSHITNQSALIDIYQLVHINIDDNFGVTRHSTQHTPTDMWNTLKTLQDKILSLNCYLHEPGSEVRGKVPNMLVKGLIEYAAKADPESNEENAKEALEDNNLDAL